MDRVRVNIKKGKNLGIGVTPRPRAGDTKLSSNVALLGRDFPGVKFEVLADEGVRVKAGAAVLRDRYRPQIVFCSPVSGTVAAVNRGARRALMSLRIDCDDEQGVAELDVPAALGRDEVRRLMLASGLWTALRTRPFGHVPDSGGEPAALLVTAMDTEPLAADPAAIINGHAENFSRGMDALTALCEAPVYLCKAPDADISTGESKRVVVAEFSGPHPAGLPGTHIHSLCPIGFGPDEAWHIGYQDVISLGCLVSTGRPWAQREIALVGPAVKRPRVLTVSCGAAVGELLADELEEEPVRVISGSALSGHAAVGAEAYLGQRHNQLTILPEAQPERGSRWKKTVFDTGLGGKPGPFVPISDLERVAPPGVLPVPLLRALLVGDVERARDLGALELVEEDLALLTYVCASKTDYGPLLRDVLDRLYKEGV
ncbi:MAG: NADH:ubiquinone reductase (Na(+)-transporting) subunit A [Gammaproteobacteria bacterium]